MRNFAIESGKIPEIVPRLRSRRRCQGRIEGRQIVECHLRDKEIAARVDRKRIGRIHAMVKDQRANLRELPKDRGVTLAIVGQKSRLVGGIAVITNDI